MSFLDSWILLGLGNTAGAEILCGEHQNLPLTSRPDDSNSYCCPSLGLGNTAGAEILEGDVWRALKSLCAGDV